MLNYLVKLCLTILLFILVYHKFFNYIKMLKNTAYGKIKTAAVCISALLSAAAAVILLTLFEFVLVAVLFAVAWFGRKKLSTFANGILCRKKGKLKLAGISAAVIFLLWFGLALFYRTDIGMPIGVKNYLYHKYGEEFDVSGFFGATVWGHPTNQFTCCPKSENSQTDSFNVTRKNTLSIGSRLFASDNYFGVLIREDYENYISTFIDDYFDEFKVYVRFDSSGLSNVKYMSDCFDKSTSLEDFLSFQRNENKIRACNTAKLIVFLDKQPEIAEKDNVVKKIESFLQQISNEQLCYTNIFFAVFKDDSKYSYDFLNRKNFYSWSSVNNWDYSPIYITSIINHEAQISHLYVDDKFFKF